MLIDPPAQLPDLRQHPEHELHRRLTTSPSDPLHIRNPHKRKIQCIRKEPSQSPRPHLNACGASTGSGGGVVHVGECVHGGCGYLNVANQHRQTLAERWNGALWLTQSTPNPRTNDDNMLAGVSCTSASACTAVDASGASGFAPFAEGWNGRSWSIEPVPTPAGVNNDPLLATSYTSRRMYRGRLLLQPHYWWCLDPGRALLVIRAFARRGRPSRTETRESGAS